MQWKITNAALALTLLWSAQTMAELYRYVDDKGVTVLDSRVPPKFISRGYEVLDAHGRVKLVVPAAPTAAEREARRAALEEQAQRDAADATLLRLYSSVADLDRAQQRQLLQIDNQITAAKTNISELRDERETLQSRAADQERAGKTVDQSILDQLAAVDAETARLQRLIQRQEEETVKVREDFARKRERMEFLLGDD